MLQFPAGNGVDLGGLSSELAHRAYTIVVLFRFDEVGQFRRVVNFAGDDRDTGLYLNDGTLTWFPGASGPTAVAADQWVQVVLTRSAAGELRGYVDGEEQFSVSDAAGDGIISDADALRFFRDDVSQQESSSGAVARIRLFNGPLSPSQVQALDRLPDVTDPTVDLRTPPDGAVYARNQAVAADFSCADEAGGSGIDTCVGTVPDGSAIDTSTVGDHDFNVTATDHAGNAAQVTHTYTVGDARPDGWIRKGATGTDLGDGVYSTGAGQTRRGSAAPGHTVSYFVSAQNDAPFPEALRLKGTASNSRFTVKYTVGGVDITPQVTAGTYLTPTLAPGATHLIKVAVTVRNTAPTGSSLDAGVTARSTTDPTVKDKVKFITRRS